VRTSIVLAFEPGVEPLGLSGDLERNLKFLSKLGYDGFELFLLNPSSVRADWLNRKRKEYGLEVSAIGTGLLNTRLGLSFSSPDPQIRQEAVRRFKEYIELSSKLSAPVIVGSVRGKSEKKHEGFEYLRECFAECYAYAEKYSTVLMLEPMNRYETNLINTVEQALDFLRDFRTSKLLVDTFHANIEEVSIGRALLEAGEKLHHLHLADSNRLAPGRGHLNFREIFSALRTLKFGGFVSAEIVPWPDPQTAAIETIQFLQNEKTTR
jgi:sugar phosphate isomerase/epimerase